MAWYSDEEYELRQDCKEKKSIVASAFKRRTHCGKGGCTLPHEFKSKKELRAMNGEVVKYASLQRPMNWEEFKKLPDDLKKAYVTGLREKFHAPNTAIAEMLNISNKNLQLYLKDLGLCTGRGSNQGKWDKEKFLAWSNGANPDAVNESAENASETPVEPAGEEIDIPVENKIEENQSGSYDHVERKRAVPGNGKMTFDGPIEEIVETLRMLLAGAEVTLDVAWSVVEPDPGVCKKE